MTTALERQLLAIPCCVLLFACGEKPLKEIDYAVAAGSANADYVSTPCKQQNPLRNAYFGDLHVHTSLSNDAWMFGVRVSPEDAYRYAFGESIQLPPYDADGSGGRSSRIDRPLDFAAVTDHAEFLGEGLICTDPQHANYQSDFCQSYRKGTGRNPRLVAQIASPLTWRYDGACGKDGKQCKRAARTQWETIIAAAQQWNDDSDVCERTTFIAYEYSSFRLGSNLHRNVIFRNAVVPQLPVSYIEAPREWDLWRLLKSGCLDSGTACDVLAIPHNSNISNGRMFNVEYVGADSLAEQTARANLRATLEPVIEVMQHKGDSECRNGMPGILNSEDELCDFEKFDNTVNEIRSGEPLANDDTCSEGWLADSIPHLGPDCVSRLSFARYALIEGLKEEQRLGVNPFKFGLSASTDTHNGLAGGVDERSFPGHLGTGDDIVAKRTAWDASIPGNIANNPGGLIGVWADQNNRDSLFDSIRRKEVFGTSGPRIQPRFFGGWDFPEGLCSDNDMIAKADALGVPMGGDLHQQTRDKAPVFLAAALADPGTDSAPGNPLQRIQIIKGWVDAQGQRAEKVYDVAGNTTDTAGVDLDSCQSQGTGHSQLCAVWRDPDFNPQHHAVYYVRAIENPSCRFNTWQCLGLKGEQRPASCDDPRIPKTIQERAWTSPIWYTPR